MNLENPWMTQDAQNRLREIPFFQRPVIASAKFFPKLFLASLGDFNGLQRKKFGNALQQSGSRRQRTFTPL
jgi:hypothetical protein